MFHIMLLIIHNRVKIEGYPFKVNKSISKNMSQLLSFFSFKNFYCFSITVVLIFTQCSHLPYPPHPLVSPYPVVHYHQSFLHVPSLNPFPSFPHYLLLPPLWSLSVCSLFPCLWFYFAHLFVLLIRFHL